jgi:hypothetical protein
MLRLFCFLFRPRSAEGRNVQPITPEGVSVEVGPRSREIDKNFSAAASFRPQFLIVKHHNARQCITDETNAKEFFPSTVSFYS